MKHIKIMFSYIINKNVFIKMFEIICNCIIAWHLYYMVTQNMLHTHEEKQVFSGRKIRNVTMLSFESNRIPYKDQITEIDPYVRTYF